jgi:hypothetical protein
MQRKILILAFLMVAAFTLVLSIPVVEAQTEGVPVVAPETTFGWAALAWLIYALAGLIANIGKEKFDAVKLTRSFLIMIITVFIAISLGISPANVETQYGGILTLVANAIVNAAPGVTLIYLVDKAWRVTANLKAKLEAAHVMTGPEPQTSQTA